LANIEQISVYLSLMARTYVAVMTTALNNSAVIIERRRDSDRWIPSKFPERTRAVRSVEAAREINSLENRDFKVQRTLDNENTKIAI
jgi:hypothetical protein